jgi:GT2 family glycosyltransferase
LRHAGGSSNLGPRRRVSLALASVAHEMNDTTTDVAVSIVNTSNCALLLRCLQTLLGEPDRRCSVDVVLLDNASTDNSVEAVRQRFPQVSVIAQTRRAGFGANHNTVIRETRSRYVYVLNEDTETSPGALDAMVEYLDAHPRCAVVGPRIVGPDGRQQGSAWRLMSLPVQAIWALTLGQRGAVISAGDRPKVVGAVSACAMLVRRETFERVGCFDESYFIFSEEADIARRLARLGYEIHYLPTAVTMHHGQQTTSGVPDRQINEHWRSFRLYTERWHPPWEARLLAWLTGLGYAQAFVAGQLARRLPAKLRPAASQTWNPGIYLLHARRAFGGPPGAGLREAADAFNQRPESAQPPTRAEGSS